MKIIDEFYDTENARIGCGTLIAIVFMVLGLIGFAISQIYIWIRY